MTKKENYSNNDIYSAINDFREEMRSCYVTNDRFIPIEKLVYGMVGVILIGVIGAMLALVINKTGVNAIW